MAVKNNYQMEAEKFRKRFTKYQKKRIVLYGIGRYTATLIPYIPDFHVIGLMDRDKGQIGKIIYGFPVLSKEEVEREADLIIINTAETYWKVIYKRIRDLKIPIFYLDGSLATDEDEQRSYQSHSYWNKNYRQLEKKCEEYDVISFDIFDTLIMRKVYMPQDVFKLAERRIKTQLGLEIPFFQERLKAGLKSKENDMALDGIYETMNRKLQLSSEDLEEVKDIEIDIEKQLCMPRQDMVELYNKLSAQKTVYLVSDMYLSSDIMEVLLKKCGIRQIQNLWISGEKKADKKSGRLWKILEQETKGRKILHIGDNYQSDVKMPQKYGIDTYYVMGSTDMWQYSSVGGFVPNIQTLEQSVFAGLVGGRIFNSPFALKESNGLVQLNNFADLGYCLWGGVIYAFLIWLVQQAEIRGVHRFVFFARDGYFLEKDYHYLQTLWKRKKMPDTCYLAISRKLILTASYKNKEDLEKIINFPYRGSFREYLEDRFDIYLTEDEKDANKQVYIPQNIGEVKKWLKPYEQKIIEQIHLEKNNYLTYLAEKNISSLDGFVDLWFYGNNQYYLSRLLNTGLTGFYFAVNKSENNECARHNQLIPCFQDESDTYAESCNLKKEMLWAEGFLTAPYGMIKAVDEKGKFICAKDGGNQLAFHTREQMNDGVCELIKDYSEILGCGSGLDAKYVDLFFGEYVKENICLAQDIKESFYFDNKIMHRWESKIFE